MPTTPEIPSGRDDPDAIQERIQRHRQRLLAGRGPGASPQRIAAAQRDRPTLGALPAPAARQRVADQTAIARDDPDALGHLAVRDTQHLARTLADLSGKADAANRKLHRTLGKTVAGAAITLSICRTITRRRSST